MSMLRVVSGVSLEIVAGDITAQPDVDCIVNAANAQLMPGGGVAGVIHRAAGPDLERECRKLAPIRPGEAVITGAHRLPNRFVIHCLGPVYGRDASEEKLLRRCYAEALRLAEGHCLASIAFPSISTGVFGYPMEEAARTALQLVIEKAPTLKSVRLVRFVLWGEEARSIHEDALNRLLS